MRLGSRIAAIFNVQPGEGRLVWLLLAYSFCVGLARILTLSAGYALYLDTFDTRTLPLVYLATTAVVSLGGLAFLHLQSRLALRPLLLVSLGAMLAVLLAFRVGLALPGGASLAIGVPIFYDLLWAISNLVFGALTGLLLNVRQGKRLFTLVETGESVAIMVGGLLTPLIGASLGAANLLLVAAAGLVGAVAVALAAARLPSAGQAEGSADEAAPRPTPLGALLRQPYVALVLLVSGLSGLCYYLLDSTFYQAAEVQFLDATALAGFLGVFFAVGEVLGLLSRTLLSGRLFARYGLSAGILAQPILVMAVTLAAILVAGLLPGLGLLFWLVALTKLLDTVVGEDISKAATLILYQALPGAARLRVQTLVDGGVTPLSTGLAGLLLLAIEALGGLGSLGRLALMLPLLAAWVVVAVLLGRAYPRVLLQAVSRRWLGAGGPAPADSASMAVFREALASPHPGVAIFALGCLEQRGDQALAALLPAMLAHPAPEVRREALGRIAARPSPKALAAVTALTASEPDPRARGAALLALAAIAEVEAVPQLAAQLQHPDPETRLGALVGMIRFGGLEGTLLAGERLLRLWESPVAGERALAARALGEIAVPSFYRPLLQLLADPDPEVRRAALAAAPRAGNPRLWPAVVEAALAPATRQAAAVALSAVGDSAAEAVGVALGRPGLDPAARTRLIRILGRMGGPQAIAVLVPLIGHPSGEVRAAAAAALGLAGYVATGPAAEAAHRAAAAEAMRAAAALAAAADVGDAGAFALLRAALLDDAAHSRDLALAFLGFLSAGGGLARARAGLSHASAERRAYAAELIELSLPVDLRPLVLPLVEELPEEERLARLSLALPLPRLGREARVEAVIRSGASASSAWARACALYVAAAAPVPLAAPAAREALLAPEALVRESAAWALSYLDQPALVRPGPVGRAGAKRSQGWSMLSTVERVLALKAAPLFASTPEPVLAELAGLLHELVLPAGATVFTKGELGTCMYIIAAGRVRVFDGPRTLIELGLGEVVGEMAILDTQPRSADVEAMEDLLLLRLDQGPFYELMEDRFEIARGIILTLSRRLRHLLA